MKYIAVIERAGRNYSAYLPDIPGCVAAGRTKAEVRRALREALAMHLEGLRGDGRRVPAPRAVAERGVV